VNKIIFYFFLFLLAHAFAQDSERQIFKADTDCQRALEKIPTPQISTDGGFKY